MAKQNLEDMTGEPSFDYNITDVFVRLKSLSYLPKIMKIKDPIIKLYEIGLNVLLTSDSVAIYYFLYESYN